MNSIQWRSKTFDFLWMIRCPICSRKLRQTKKSAILEESRRWFIFSFIFFWPFSIILQVVYLSVLWRVQTTTDIGPWLASFLSEILARLHHMVMLSYSFCFREFWCKRLTRVVPACRAVRTAPDSALTSGGKTLLKKQKKKRCVCGAFLYFLDSLSSSSNISCVTQKVLFLLKKHLAVRQTIATAKTTQMAR